MDGESESSTLLFCTSRHEITSFSSHFQTLLFFFSFFMNKLQNHPVHPVCHQAFAQVFTKHKFRCCILLSEPDCENVEIVKQYLLVIYQETYINYPVRCT